MTQIKKNQYEPIDNITFTVSLFTILFIFCLPVFFFVNISNNYNKKYIQWENYHIDVKENYYDLTIKNITNDNIIIEIISIIRYNSYVRENVNEVKILKPYEKCSFVKKNHIGLYIYVYDEYHKYIERYKLKK